MPVTASSSTEGKDAISAGMKIVLPEFSSATDSAGGSADARALVRLRLDCGLVPPVDMALRDDALLPVARLPGKPSFMRT